MPRTEGERRRRRIQQRRRRTRDRQCTGKVRYASEDIALADAAAMANRTGLRFNAYGCVWCGACHIGGDAQGTIVPERGD